MTGITPSGPDTVEDAPMRICDSAVTQSLPAMTGITPSGPDTVEDAPMRICDSAIMKQILLACDWVEENRTHFAGKVQLPPVTKMSADDALLAITMRDLFVDTIFYEGDMDADQIRAPFLFTFERMEDMHFFLEEVYDKRNIRVSCMHIPHF
ncbi:structural maintenance of chromosomes protein 5-like [Misgurnus anguillicaudatus]|uniref:structural maintenance of chromosomes protein 5-like n=1 Tax=Misgurnus anguillicaudatus TaxID=75329 RepID=UPI003CCF2A64